MRVYLDSSALIKRSIVEVESDAFVAALDEHHRAGDFLVSSSLAWVEVTRALRTATGGSIAGVAADVDGALSGVAEYPLTGAVVSLARRVGPNVLRSLDALHVATALLVDSDLLLTYDDRLAAACTSGGILTASPGR